MEALLLLLKELLGLVAPRYVPLAAAGVAVWFIGYLSYGIPALRRRLNALEADRLTRAEFATATAAQNKRLDDYFELVLKALGRGSDFVTVKLAHAAADMISPAAAIEAREWERLKKERK